ncbi:conjugative transposon protein TraK [Filimonas effusa]|uniref:Conjugative transposon protein TraK n=1 Tax=Filimonas effusa TaxID=2508721 RepID=A0A4Q1DDM8_9BACT|nr:conjugative transposon protein TraK [Filimonas effusa]RXK86985.1 conjugative transposon protein TraK [Filimonas effusa]
MFTKFKSIDSAFRAMRLFMLCVIAMCLIICGLTVFKGYEVANKAQNRIYVLMNGKALEAIAAERKDNIPVEARDHVKTFHTLFFTLDPDEKVIQGNITKALYLADGSAKKQYEDLKEANYYTNIISGNVSQQLTVDSVSINMDQYPYSFRCFATQKITRPTSIVLRNLITEGQLRNVSRSDNNPHGFLIERWITLQNRDIKTEAR